MYDYLTIFGAINFDVRRPRNGGKGKEGRGRWKGASRIPAPLSKPRDSPVQGFTHLRKSFSELSLHVKPEVTRAPRIANVHLASLRAIIDKQPVRRPQFDTPHMCACGREN